MRAETVLLDDTNQISRVQNEEDRAQNRALRDSAHECSDDSITLLSYYGYGMLPACKMLNNFSTNVNN